MTETTTKVASKPKSQNKNKMSEIDDHILQHFSIKKRLGKGAYGIVWKALHRKTNQTVAVKKIFDAFRDETDAQRTFREVMFLRAFHSHPNIIQLQDIYKACNDLDIYLTFEFMESDLHNVIKKGNILKDVHKRYIMYQLLNAVRYIHSGNVIHRDLKPSNILIDTKCKCKLADFGLARSVSSQSRNFSNEPTDPALTDYVATRWYRAPEILVASKKYTKGIDMWSLGCILGEMIRGKPIFQGSSTVDQIEKIVSALPEISQNEVLAVGAGFGSTLLNKPASSINAASLDDILVNGTTDGINLVKSLLVFDPLARLTADGALKHKYVERFRHSIQERKLKTGVVLPFDDDVRLNVSDYRTKLYELVHQHNPPSEKPPDGQSKLRDAKLNRKCESVSKLTVSAERSNCREQRLHSTASTQNVYNTSSQHFLQKNNQGAYILKPGATAKTNISLSVMPVKTMSEAKMCSASTKDKTSMRTAKNGTKQSIHASLELNTKPPISKQIKKHILDKRRSLDGSCSLERTTPISKHITEQEKRSNVVNRNFSTTKQHSTPNTTATTTKSSKTREPNNRMKSSSRSSESHERKRFEAHKSENKSNLSEGGNNYYENRLKKLEEQIEKHKRDIKAFCLESTPQLKSPIENKSLRAASDKIIGHKNDKSSKSLYHAPRVTHSMYERPVSKETSRCIEKMYAGGDDTNFHYKFSSKIV